MNKQQRTREKIQAAIIRARLKRLTDLTGDATVYPAAIHATTKKG